MPLPRRQHLQRIPVWLPLEQPVIYFITACAADRQPVWRDPRTVRVTVTSLQALAARWEWDALKLCLMPDHIHLLVAPLREREQDLSAFIRGWKASVTRQLGRAIWQAEFHDRLLRSDEKLDAQWEYIRFNPVRAGLCAEPEDYPYSGTPKEILEHLGKA